MYKRKRTKEKIIVLIIVLLIFLFLPIDSSSKLGKNGSKVYSPMLGWYQIVDYKDTNTSSHEDKVGREIRIFGIKVYDSTHPAD